jgi:hypothetical protein
MNLVVVSDNPTNTICEYGTCYQGAQNQLTIAHDNEAVTDSLCDGHTALLLANMAREMTRPE